jgi:hypothetical protein
VHLPTAWQRLMERLRGRDQRLVRPGEGYPLFLLSFGKGHSDAIDEIETIFAHRLPSLPHRILEPYVDTIANLPAMVVVILRPRNPCGCLGHYHPRGTESRLCRRISADLANPVGELDLAYQAIRGWEPHPISALATGGLDGRLVELRFEAALLAVFLHELQHVAFPDRGERDIRGASNNLYMEIMQELVSQEGGTTYGLRSLA